MAVGDVTFTSEWPVAAAGTMDKDDIGGREFLVVPDDLTGAGSRFYWSADGTTGGLQMGSSVGFAWVQMTDGTDSKGIGTLGLSGPMMDKATAADAGKPDQYCWRTTYYSGGLGLALTTVFNVGDNAQGQAAARGANRRFCAYFMPHS